MADLEALSNDDLRKKLIEHGLGTIPLTATTRKVLINKLQKSINGEVDTKTASSDTSKAKGRRETMHVSKPAAVQDEKVEQKKPEKPTKRRATLDAAAAPVVPIVAVPSVSAGGGGAVEKNTRRSGRITPQPKTRESKSIISAPTTILVLDEEDESAEEISNGRNEIALPPPSQIVDRNRSSRSQSLGKSGTVTTSYKSVAEVETIKESTNEIDQSYEDENDDDDEPEIYTQKQTTYIPAARSVKTHDIVFSSDLKDRRRFTAFTGADREAPKPASLTTSGFASQYDDAAYKRRTTTAAEFNRQRTPSQPPPPIYLAYSTNSDSDDLEIPAGSTPYLSDFAKRLSRLRAEPLASGVISTDGGGASSSSLHYGGGGDSIAIQRRRISGVIQSGNKIDDSLWQSFKLLLYSLERKLRPILLLSLIVLIAVFIYVFFFTNN